MKASLHDIAPRLAVARDLRRWEVDTTGDYNGQDWCTITDHEHSTGPCRGCGGTADRYYFRDKILLGVNAGVQCENYWVKCRRCRGSIYSSWRRPW